MNTVKYPDGSIREIIHENGLKHKNNVKAKLGQDFEKAINEANEYYLTHDLAAIYKKPTPIQIVKVDYPARNKARISEAYYKTPSTTDYNGIYKGKYIDFEAKSTQENFFSFERIYEHQVKHLETVERLGGISFLIIEFSKKNEIYILSTKDLVTLYNLGKKEGRKSIPYLYFVEHGIKVMNKYNIRIDYLTAVDQMFFDNTKN